MTSNQHGPYVRGDTRVTMAENRGEPRGDTEPIPKIRLSSDWSLQPDSMKLDSLVIAHQPWRGEYVPGPCTHRPSHHPSRLHPKSPAQPREGGAEGVEGEGGEVVTR